MASRLTTISSFPSSFLGGHTNVRPMYLRSEVVLRLDGGWMPVQACKMFFLGEWGEVYTMEKKIIEATFRPKNIQTYITRKEKSQRAEKDIS